jgi:cell division transport system permease protein
MKIRTFVRHIREGVKSVFRNGWMTVASISAMSVSLLVLGLFLMLAMNVNQFAKHLESQVEVRVFLQLDAKKEDISRLEFDLKSMDAIREVKFVSKADALNYLKGVFKDDQNFLDGLEGENNPLNESFTIQVAEPREVAAVAKAIENWDTQQPESVIERVRYGQGAVEELFRWTEILRNVGLVFVLMLGMTSMFLISNTIKLTIIARRREISIMKMVGATNSFIRWPFFIEGMVLGVIGSLIPASVLVYGYFRLNQSEQFQSFLGFVQLVDWQTIAFPLTVLLLGIGLVIGVWGSIFSVRKFLRV